MGVSREDTPRALGGEAPGGPLAALGRRVAARQDEALERMLRRPTDERMAHIYRREAALALGAGRDLRRAGARRAVYLAIAACLAAVMVLFVKRDPDALTYQVGSGPGEEPGSVGRWVAADAAPVPLHFSDGSRVDVIPGGRARVTELGARHASLLLERGTAHVRVVPRERNAWVVVGGPFEVHVVGTEFDVTWSAESEALSVRMDSGRVRIEGPCIEPGGRYLEAPHAIRVTCVAEAPPSERASADAPTTAALPSALSAPAATTSAAGALAPVASWRAKLRAGSLRDAFAEAEAAGLEGVAASATGPELVDLGSAARLAGEPAAATRLYLAARERAPGQDAAASAAYHLGRMAFDGRGAWSEAEKWFGVYLAERPGGALAPEALGRSMECAQKRGDAARASEIAQRYLAAYPKGAHAALAASLVSGPP